MKLLKSALPHVFALLLFTALSALYFSPAIQGKKLYQSDAIAMAANHRSIADHQKKTGEYSLWGDALFSGMPLYFWSQHYRQQNNVVHYLDSALNFLPQPLNYLFILMLGFYILLLSLEVEPLLAVLGAIAFSFCSYFIISIAAGHNQKMTAIAYIAPTIGGILLLFRKRYALGFVLTSLFLALNIYAGHPQMTYYLSLLMGLYMIFQIIYFSRTKEWKAFAKIIGLLAVASLIALAINAAPLLTIRQYAPYSIRGKSDLKASGRRHQAGGLSRAYITAWSYGKVETLDLLIPNLMGGPAPSSPDYKPRLREALIKKNVSAAQADYALRAIPTYWGDQPFTSGPYYQGAVVIFLFILGLFLVRGQIKWWLAIAVFLSILFSWGKHFPLLTNFLIDHFPLYDRFRAVTRSLIIFDLAAPLLGVLALRRFLSSETAAAEKRRSLKYTAGIMLGLTGFLLLVGRYLLGFENQTVDPKLPPFLREAIRADRIALFQADALRSFGMVLAVSLLLYLISRKKLSYKLSLFLLGALILVDLWPVDKRYLNKDNFVLQRAYDNPFPKGAIEREILEDTSNFRVLNLAVNTMADVSTSYYFKSIGGYHPAKLGRYQELYDFQISKGNQQVIDMLNAKYIIEAGDHGARKLVTNTEANGNAWFVKGITYVRDADAEMAALDTLQTKAHAVAERRFDTPAIDAFKPEEISTSPGDSIFLKRYAPNELVYDYRARTPQLAVLSEIYYPAGWKATIDGRAAPYFSVDYVLRALWVPAGQHEIVFSFDPPIVRTGQRIALGGSILLILTVGFSLFSLYRNRRKEPL